jgi:hypothetical protein
MTGLYHCSFAFVLMHLSVLWVSVKQMNIIIMAANMLNIIKDSVANNTVINYHDVWHIIKRFIFF